MEAFQETRILRGAPRIRLRGSKADIRTGRYQQILISSIELLLSHAACFKKFGSAQSQRREANRVPGLPRKTRLFRGRAIHSFSKGPLRATSGPRTKTSYRTDAAFRCS